MRPDLIALGMGFLLASCSSGNPTSPNSGSAAGWHDAGLVLSQADQSAGGVEWLATMDSQILALTASGKLFLGRQGSTHWDSIASPVGGAMYSLLAKDSLFYVGTALTGDVWSFSPQTRKWVDLHAGGTDSMRVASLCSYQNQVVVFLSRIYGWQRPILQWNGSTMWTQINSGWNDSEETTTSLSVGSTIFATTYSHGLWRRSTTDPTWSRIPDPIYLETFANDSVAQIPMDKPRCLAWYHGNLWMGNLYYGQIFHLTGTETPWIPIGMDSSASGMSQFPLSFQAMAMIVWKDRLFAAGGQPSIPAVLKEGSGWQFMSSNWGKSDDGGRNVCGVDLTLSFAAIGDTLYAAGCGHIFKLPWSLVPN